MQESLKYSLKSRILNLNTHNMKHLLYRWTFLVLATTILFSCDPKKDYDVKISAILQQDAAIVPAANGDDTAVATEMRRLDLSQCPSDFATVYVDHIHAWDRSAEIQRALTMIGSADNTKKVLIETALQKIFGSDHNALSDALEQETALKAAAVEASKQIKATFDEVERVAVSYGARLPH
jgi:hypothetical protein